MPYMEEHENATGTQSSKEPKKLILCFDGTGNTFSGSNADTNVVKLLSKLDRNHPDQFHYYQTGIGTYGINETSVNKTWYGEMKSSFSKAIDQGFGTTFDAHVIAGYRFLMRYYVSGAKIYIFGFSRGAFTAKFLARMINKVGLLCKGNEEMVPFAYLLYQRYLSGHIQDRVVAQQRQCGSHPEATEGSDTETESLLQGPDGTLIVESSHQTELALNEITAFSRTFCRKETTIKTTPCGKMKEVEENIKVYFLGIWDCVNSVAVLEKKTPVPVPVTGTAHFVRHAVSVDERRVKFKPALLAMDRRASENIADEDIKEVWFPGNHGDVGGGWPSVADNPLDNNRSDEMTFWQRIKNFCLTRKAKEASKNIDSDRLQMSDIPLAWMIRELELVGAQEPTAAVKWCKSVELFKRRFKEKKEYALKAFMHDTLSFGYGLAFAKVLMWKFMEYLPIINRWELKENGWVNVRFPLNKGSTRDIPTDAELHESLIWRLRNVDSYNPKNNHGDDLPPCLKYDGKVADVEKILQTEGQPDPDHQTYRLVQNK